MFDSKEKQLIKCTQDGETEAFSPLVSKYHHRLYTHILGRVKDSESAKDLMQETWFRAFRAINTFRGDASFYSWLYRIAENVCLDYFRRQKHRNAIEPLDTIDTRRIRERYPCPSLLVERCELGEHLSAAIAQLTTIRRKVFCLYYVDELPIKAIAARIGRSEDTIKSHLRNARLQLKEILTPYVLDS